VPEDDRLDAPTASTPDGDKGRVQSVDRAADLLRAVAAARGQHAVVRELAGATGLNRATAWRILRTLEAQGMVHRDPRTREYTIGTTVVDLARSAPTDTWTSRARRQLETLSLQTREITALALHDGGDLRYVDEVMPPGTTDQSWLGSNVDPKHATSSGKVLLAYAGRPVRSFVDDPLERYTETTITSMQALEDEIAQVRSQGYALCRGEWRSNLWGVSAPLMAPDQRLLGALSCWGPASRGEPDRFAALGSLVREAARGLVTI
jgi:IclR family acetate operon transcriptional repressor